MAGVERIELPLTQSERAAKPLGDTPTKLVHSRGIEPALRRLKVGFPDHWKMSALIGGESWNRTKIACKSRLVLSSESEVRRWLVLSIYR